MMAHIGFRKAGPADRPACSALNFLRLRKKTGFRPGPPSPRGLPNLVGPLSATLLPNGQSAPVLVGAQLRRRLGDSL